MLSPESLQQLLDLDAALSRFQSQVCRNDLEMIMFAFDIEIDRSARLTARLTEIDTPNLLLRTTRQDGIPIVPGVMQEGRPCNGSKCGLFCKPIEQFQSLVVSGIHFLQGDHIRIEFTQHTDNALRIISPIPSRAPVNIVCHKGHAHKTTTHTLSVISCHLQFKDGI